MRLLGCVSRTDVLWVKMFPLAELGGVLISELVPVEDRAAGRDDKVQTAGHTGSKSYLKDQCRRISPR